MQEHIIKRIKTTSRHDNFFCIVFLKICPFCNFGIQTLNVTTSGRNCNTIFDVLTSNMPNADRSKHAFVCGGGDFVLLKSEHQNKYDRKKCNLLPVIP